MATVIAGDRKVEFGKLAPNAFKMPPNAFMLPANTNYFLPLQRSSSAESTASPFENLVESI